jgi:hypothetical protein
MTEKGRLSVEEESLLSLKLQEVERLKDLLTSTQAEVVVLQRKQRKTQRRAIVGLPAVQTDRCCVPPNQPVHSHLCGRLCVCSLRFSTSTLTIAPIAG